MSLNTRYMLLIHNPRDVSQITVLGMQIHSNKSKLLAEAFRDAMSTSYGYLLIDTQPYDKFRRRPGIFPDDTPLRLCGYPTLSVASRYTPLKLNYEVLTCHDFISAS
jgi:hypothetical protein